MTFELSSDLLALQARARDAAGRIAPLAAGIDAEGLLPAALGLDDLLPADAPALATVLVTEELAVASAAVAAAVGLGATSAGKTASELPGLRGLEPAALTGTAASRVPLVLAAAAVGIGRAAVGEALAAARAAGERPTGNPEDRPHWTLADAATEVEGARLLTIKAAQGVQAGADATGAHLAKVFAADVAGRAVDAALRILGPDGYKRGTTIERLARDARTIALVGGTADEERARAADALLS